MAERGRVAGHRDAGVGVRAEGRPALRPQVLGRSRDRAAAQGAHRRRAQRSRSSSSRSPTSRSARRSTREMVKPSWPSMPPDWQVQAIAAGRRRHRRTPAGPSRGCRPASSRSSKASGRCAASASRWRISSFPTASSPFSVFVEPIARRAARRSASPQAGRPQRRTAAQQRRQSRHGAGRSARRHGAADRALRRAPLSVRCVRSMSMTPPEADLP